MDLLQRMMSDPTDSPPPETPPQAHDASAPGPKVALVYALVAHQLSTYFEHGRWMTTAQGATLCGEWLARRKLTLSASERQRLSALGSEMAEGIQQAASREAGLFISHELMESLDARYESDIGKAIMAQCAVALGQ